MSLLSNDREMASFEWEENGGGVFVCQNERFHPQLRTDDTHQRIQERRTLVDSHFRLSSVILQFILVTFIDTPVPSRTHVIYSRWW